jgi:hypothetical protein
MSSYLDYSNYMAMNEPAFQIGDTVRTRTGKTTRVVTRIEPPTPASEWDMAMAKFEAGRGCKPLDFTRVTTRALRDGKEFGPILTTRASKLTKA